MSDEARVEKKLREKGHEEYLARQYPLKRREKRLNEAFVSYIATTPGTEEARNALKEYRKRSEEYDGKRIGD